jgi:Flp pilus assembly protein TadD
VSAQRFGDALETSLRTGDAARALREIRASDSTLYPTAYREGATAIALLQLGRGAEAERVATRAVRREPENVQTWLALARVQVTRREFAAARLTWARTRRLDPHQRAHPLAFPSARP